MEEETKDKDEGGQSPGISAVEMGEMGEMGGSNSAAATLTGNGSDTLTTPTAHNAGGPASMPGSASGQPPVMQAYSAA